MSDKNRLLAMISTKPIQETEKSFFLTYIFMIKVAYA
jgi:hypothetical protein